MEAIYLDNHASTRVDPRVVDAMLPFFGDRFGNPSSRAHAFGQNAADAVEAARASVARAIGAEPREIVFTSGATESNRLALESVPGGPPSSRFVCSAIEHKSILDKAGDAAAVVRPPPSGVVEPAAIRAAIGPGTRLVAVMAANNEIGTIQPVAEIGRICQDAGVSLLCDATAAIGRIEVDVRRMAADFLSFSGHKIYGPKGVGVLYARGRSGKLPSRPGTPNVPGIVGLAVALDLCLSEREAEAVRLRALRDRLLDQIRAAVDRVEVNGDLERRLPGNLNVAIAGVDGRALQVLLEGLAISSGAACSTGGVEPSHVLVAIGRSRDLALASLRFGIGRFNTAAEIDLAAAIVSEAVRKLRGGARFRSGGLESDRVLGNTSHADRL